MADVVTFPGQSTAPELEFELEPSAAQPSDELELELEPNEVLLEVDSDSAVPGVLESTVEPVGLMSTALVEILPADFQLPLLTKFVPNPALRTAVQEAAQQALAIQVTGAEGLTAADQALDVVRANIKAVEAHFEDPVGVAFGLHRRLTGLRGEWTRDGADAITTVGRRVYDESERLKSVERERIRQEQAAADQKAREEAAAQAKQAEAQQAPPEVVEDLKEQARTATAAPVSRSSSVGGGMSRNTTTKTYKARIAGTPADAENLQPDTADLSPAQRTQVLTAMKAVIEGRAPLAIFAIDWSYLDKRAKADKTAMGIPGFEAYVVGGVRAKGGR